MGSTLVENLAIDESTLMEYPITRMEAACSRWARRTRTLLARNGVASALALFEQDLADLTDQQRSACEKIFAALRGSST